MLGGTIADASLIATPPSKKNTKSVRDPEMHQSKKCNQWFFGMKLHISVDDVLGVVHSFETTAGVVHDLDPADRLLHGQESRVWIDAGYRGMEKRLEYQRRRVDWFIALTPSLRRGLSADSPRHRIEKEKASVRAKGEHPFR